MSPSARWTILRCSKIFPTARINSRTASPVTPVFDALSYFQLDWKVGYHSEVSAFVHDIKPLTYKDPDATADVVVVSLKQYKATYAADSSDAPDGRAHITMTPYDFIKNAANPDRTFFLSDVVIDNASDLPLSVTYSGGDNTTFVCDYGSEQGHWVVQHVHYETTLHGPLRIGQLHVIADAKFDNFKFPADAPDPRLVVPRAPEQPSSVASTPPPA